MFQLFSAALWLLDAYWQYTMMTLVQILVLESTTVFQRLKTLKTLKGMSVKAFAVLWPADAGLCLANASCVIALFRSDILGG